MRGTPRCGGPGPGLGRIIPAHAGNSAITTGQGSWTSDHPRACGELSSSTPNIEPPIGCIPAHAGNSFDLVHFSHFRPDHPRACGELLVRRVGCDLDRGSSPRMRGTRQRSAVLGVRRRIIPAHAGNSRRTASDSSVAPDHPRACGELDTIQRHYQRYTGSSPRMRGTPLEP